MLSVFNRTIIRKKNVLFIVRLHIYDYSYIVVNRIAWINSFSEVCFYTYDTVLFSSKICQFYSTRDLRTKTKQKHHKSIVYKFLHLSFIIFHENSNFCFFRSPRTTNTYDTVWFSSKICQSYCTRDLQTKTKQKHQIV